MSQATLDLSQFLTTADQLWELFVNADSWLQGQYLCQALLASSTTSDRDRQLAQTLLDGQWPEQWGVGACHWPARDETVYLKRWCPVMAFGGRYASEQNDMLSVELQALTTDYGDVDTTRFDEALSCLMPEQINEIKSHLAA